MFQLEVKRLREERGLSQRQLAQQLSVSQGTVGCWESGKRKPSYETLTKIANFFGVSTDSLLGRDAAADTSSAKDAGEATRRNELDDVELAFMGDYRELTEDDKATIRDMIRVMRERRQKKEAEKNGL